ncbi:MAG: esterase [Dehalococcoidia bacterium]|nr:esterase [Dehalococcoidia bacterium]
MLKERVIPFTAGDGMECNLLHVHGDEAPVKGPVMLVHGAGVRANIFRAPIRKTIVEYLIEEGYDVWLENWRASIDLPANQWTLDEAALYDHPHAVRKVLEITGASEMKALIHCQGSTSFMMSVMAGLVPQVKTVVSNAVSLHPVIPLAARAKIKFMLLGLARLYPYLNPQWGLHAPTLPAKLLSLIVWLTHHECDNAVCKQVSFTYGVGFPTLWSHENLNDETHEWIREEFGQVPRSFFKQIQRSIDAGRLVSVDGKAELPDSFVASPPRTDARVALFAGDKNLCFLPESQVKTYEYLASITKNYHSLNVIPGYGHLDIFLGKNAAEDVFPLIVKELDEPR